MKKIISVLVALTLVLCMPVLAFAVEYKGDVDKNGEINSADALAILKYSVGLDKEIDVKYADINGDGQVNSADALIALQISVGLVEAQKMETEEPDKKDDYSTDEIVEIYNTAVVLTEKCAPKGQITMKLDGDITGDGSLVAVLKVASPILESTLERNSMQTDSIPGYEADLLVSDIKNATAVSKDGIMTLNIQLNEQTDGYNADANNAGSVSRGIGTLGNIDSAVNELGAEIYAGKENIYLHYNDAYINCTIDESTGKITHGTWHYKVNVSVSYAEIKLGLKFIITNLKACIDYTVVI